MKFTTTSHSAAAVRLIGEFSNGDILLSWESDATTKLGRVTADGRLQNVTEFPYDIRTVSLSSSDQLYLSWSEHFFGRVDMSGSSSVELQVGLTQQLDLQ